MFKSIKRKNNKIVKRISKEVSRKIAARKPGQGTPASMMPLEWRILNKVKGSYPE